MTLLFKKQFINKIRKGQKTQTRRIKKPRIKIGKTYRLRQDYTTSLPDRIKITDLYQQYLGEITSEDIIQEGFTSKKDFKSEWAEIYGAYNPEEYIWVVEFQYIGSTETFKEKP